MFFNPAGLFEPSASLGHWRPSWWGPKAHVRAQPLPLTPTIPSEREGQTQPQPKASSSVSSPPIFSLSVYECAFPFFVQTLSFSELTEYSERHILKSDHFFF